MNRLELGSRHFARVIAIDGHDLYIEAARHILRSSDRGQTWQSIVTLPSKITGYGRIHRRLLRLGIHACTVMPDGNLVFVSRKHIWHYDTTKKSLESVFSIPRGSRPLYLCQTPNHHLYFGEYFNNRERESVNIYGATYPDLQFQSVYRFPQGRIRHIHGVFFDPYTDSLWVTTGDIAQEATIWRSNDHFVSLEPIIGGSQQYRAVSLLFTEDSIYFGSDTPLEKNYLYRIRRRTGEVDTLQEVQGPVFYGCKANSALFFATVVEPSKVNASNQSFIWGSQDGNNWHCLKAYEKDLWPAKIFQYGQILFPVGSNHSDILWFTPLATEKDQTIQQLDFTTYFEVYP